MNRFRIGDEVRVVAYEIPDSEYMGKSGPVVELPNSRYIRVDLGGSLGTPLFLHGELAPLGDPKPLTLNDGGRQSAVVSAPGGVLGARTGGKARFTVRDGWTTRKDTHHWTHGRRIYRSGWYR